MCLNGHFQETGVTLHPYLPITATSLQRPLSSVTKVTIVERFNCISILGTKRADFFLPSLVSYTNKGFRIQCFFDKYSITIDMK